MPERPVVMTIGDGTFMYNPVVPAIAFADEHKLPLFIVVANNAKYSAMQHFHHQVLSGERREDDGRLLWRSHQGPKIRGGSPNGRRLWGIG